ncbi:hypothetical protein KFE18_08525 [Clostridiaceae bacterium Marseille-Q4143]|nr:hypothetical protein KFE18_08525 [Clostridiaceae bacterium Marseille-Q4143]
MSYFDKKKIAFIYEGIQAEEDLLNNMKHVYLSRFYEVETFHLPADGNIYMLWKRLIDDEFETNVIDLLKEMSEEARQRIAAENLKASDFSEIYLFFDYDGHAAQFSEETLEEANELCIRLGMPEVKNKRDLLERMLLVFQNETEYGKLYISYPMIESLKEISKDKEEYKRLFITLESMPRYKHLFFEKSDYEKFSSLTEEMWGAACRASVKQAGLIVRKKTKCTYKEFIEELNQLNIYHAQKEMYINAPEERILAILNSVPLFLLEYFEERFWSGVIK